MILDKNTGDDARQEAIVVGGGPAGLTAAIALASGGVATVLIGSRPAAADNRTTALLAGSVTALDTLGVWPLCREQAAPLKVMRIVDDTGRLWRAPEVRFDADEIGLEAFGYNIENRHLVAALEERARALPGLRLVDGQVTGLNPGDGRVTVSLEGGASYAAPLAVGADGRRSLCREAAGIGLDEHRTRQVALTVCFGHSRPHRDTSTEFHTPSGPFTVVPLGGTFPGEVGTGSPSGNATGHKLGQRSSLVWVLDPDDADDIAALDDGELSAAIERGCHSILGKVTVEPGRGLFPLTVATARRFGAHRIALVGEAAHVIPPIGAQGLNLGLRDAATIGELAAEAHRRGTDIGSDVLLTRYDRMRRADVGSRTFAVDLLNRTLLSDLLPAQGARGLGLYMVDRIGPLRRTVMREGVAPRGNEPRLMRGEAL